MTIRLSGTVVEVKDEAALKAWLKTEGIKAAIAGIVKSA